MGVTSFENGCPLFLFGLRWLFFFFFPFIVSEICIQKKEEKKKKKETVSEILAGLN